MNDPNHVEHQYGTISGQRVVEARRVRDVVDLLHVLAQQQLRVLRRHSQTIDPDVLTSNVAANPYDITFVSRDNHQLILLEESCNRGVTLTALLSGFDRKCKPSAIVESEANNRVGDGLACPV